MHLMVACMYTTWGAQLSPWHVRTSLDSVYGMVWYMSAFLRYVVRMCGVMSRLSAAAPHAREYCKLLADTQGVVLLPDSVYGYEGGHRVCVGFGRNNFEDALSKLSRAVRALGPCLGRLVPSSAIVSAKQ